MEGKCPYQKYIEGECPTTPKTVGGIVRHSTQVDILIKINKFCLFNENSRSFVLFDFNIKIILIFVKFWYQPNKKCTIVYNYIII